MEGVVCKHFQTGFCKFQEHCRKQHVKEICETENCKTKTCKYRHPKVCKFFTAHSTCKFGEQCAYHHKATKAGNEIIEIMIKINALENTVTLLSEKIIFLEEELKSKDMETQSSSTQIYQCEKCDYKASTKPVLKRHITTKHKENIPTPEKERCKDYDDPIKPMMTLDERAEALYSPPQPQEIITSMHFKCNICGHKSDSAAGLQGHTSINHDFNIPHTSKWDKNKCYICNINFKETVFFKNHMIEEHGFLDDSDKCMNCESTDVGLYLPVPQQYVFMNCIDCQREEDEEQ